MIGKQGYRTNELLFALQKPKITSIIKKIIKKPSSLKRIPSMHVAPEGQL